jgi:hypothetical protein
MYNSLLHFHSGTRWIVLILLLFTILNSYSNWKTGKSFGVKDKLSALLTLIFTHIQLLVGLILYFMSPWVRFGSGMMSDAKLRFYTIEHFIMMIAAVAVITIGYSRSKKAENDKVKHRKLFVWYLIALLIIMAAIPWPFRIDGANWF